MFKKNIEVYYYYPVLKPIFVKLGTKMIERAWRIQNQEYIHSGTENFTLWDKKENLINRIYEDIETLKDYIIELEQNDR
jgi:hypothetical protein